MIVTRGAPHDGTGADGGSNLALAKDALARDALRGIRRGGHRQYHVSRDGEADRSVRSESSKKRDDNGLNANEIARWRDEC